MVLGAALHHGYFLPDEPKPLETFLGRIVPEPRGFKQFCVPLEPRRERPGAYRRDKLMLRLAAGELFSLLVETPVGTPEDERVEVGARVHPSSPKYGPYRVTLALGSAALARLGTTNVIDALVDLADALAVVGGVVYGAESVAFAACLASGGSVGSLTPEQNRIVNEDNYAVHWLGDKARGPAWGTFLSAAHVATLGGVERLRAGPGCAVVRELASGGAYLQVSEELVLDADLTRVRAILAPVVLDRSTLP